MTETVIDHYCHLDISSATMVILEASCVSDHGKLTANPFGLRDDCHIEGMKAAADAIHEGGTAAIVQIHHEFRSVSK